MDVGMTPEQKAWFNDYAEVEAHPSDPERRVLFIPSGLARVQMLARFAGPDKLLLYLDGDTLIFGSVEPMIQRFLESGKAIGLAAEDNRKVWFAYTMSEAWEGSIPEQDFPRWRQWQNEPVMNTGVILATGSKTAAVSELAKTAYEKYRLRLRWSEQTAIDSAVYELGISYHRLSLQEHFFGREKLLKHSGPLPYLHDAPIFDGRKIIIRHFCYENKKLLAKLLPGLQEKWGLPTDGSHVEASQPVEKKWWKIFS